MALTLKQKQELSVAVASTKIGREIAACIASNGGQHLSYKARQAINLLVASDQIGRRICAIINAGTGILRPLDAKALIIGLGEQSIGHEVVAAINANN